MKFTTARIAAVVAVAGVVLFGANAASAQTSTSTAVDLGKGSVVKTIGATSITNIGGSFVSRRTTLGGFKLPPGTWLITSNATFTRTAAAKPSAAATRPQLALRYGWIDGKGGGTSAGTIAGADISPAKEGVLTGSTVQTVTTTVPVTQVMVYGFGVNDDGSSRGCRDITVSAQITATRIG